MTTVFQEALLEIGGITSLLENRPELVTRTKVIDRVLGKVGWDISSTEVDQEYPIPIEDEKDSALDYALRIDGQNRVFIEAKKWGRNLDPHEAQLFKYCNAVGEEKPKLAILTNGRLWRLYIPPSKDHPELRRFLDLDVTTHELDEVERHFRKFLSHDSIKSMKRTPSIAYKLWNDRVKDESVMKALTDAWDKLTRNRREQVALLKRFVSSRDKIQAEEEHIRRFLDSSNALFNEASVRQGSRFMPKPRGFTFSPEGEGTADTITFKPKSWNRYAHGLAELMYRRHPDKFVEDASAIPRNRFINYSNDSGDERNGLRIEDSNVYFQPFGRAEDLKNLGFAMLKTFGYPEDSITILFD